MIATTMSARGLAVRFAPRISSGALRPLGTAIDLGGAYPLGVCALAGLYYGAAQLGFALDFSGAVAAIVWLPAGVGIAFLYLAGLRFWPGVLLGDLLVNNYTGLPLGSALGQTCGNVLEIVIATLLIRRLVPDGSPLGSVPGLVGLLAGLAIGTTVSATIGSLSLRLGDVVSGGALPTVWRTWWLGDFSGALILVPLAIAWYPPSLPAWFRRRALEGALLLAVVLGLGELGLHGHWPLLPLIFPALIWATLRFEQRGATLAIAVAATFTVWQIRHYTGPFELDSIGRSTLAAQLYLGVVAVSTLCLAAVVSERERLTRQLRGERARLIEARASERRRIEHNLHDGAQQRLTALVVRLGLAADDAVERPEGATAVFRKAGSELSLAIDELRELSHGLQPPLLTEFGLAGAISELAGRSTIPIRVLEMTCARLDETAEAAAYYLIVETVANAEKHARASLIDVRASVTPGFLEVEVIDDGIGGATESGGYGLQGLRDRVEGLGGTFEIASPPGAGTRIAAAIPATVLGE